MALAEAVNAEALELQNAGADVIQLDEPWCATIPAAANAMRSRQSTAPCRASRCPTVVHICFAMPPCPGDTQASGYSSWPNLPIQRRADSIEAAQPKLDLGVLCRSLGEKDHAGRDRSRPIPKSRPQP